MSDHPVSAAPLRECKFCGLFQEVPPLAPGTGARCRRCGATLRTHRSDPAGRALALAVAGLLLFALAATEPFLDLDVSGQSTATSLVTGPVALSGFSGLWAVSLVVLVTTVAAPAAKLAAVLWVLVGLRLDVPGARLRPVFRWVERLSPWSMIEVFLLGVFVAYVKLAGLASVHVGLAVYALGGLMLTMAATDAVLDHEAIWSRLEPHGLQLRCAEGSGAWIGCDCCGQVSRRHADRRLACPRCAAPLDHRIEASLGRSAALLIAAAVLYIPANTLPVLTAIQLGRGEPDTILSGVQELAAAGQWPLAAVVFIASIAVPVLKLAGMAWLLIATRLSRSDHLPERDRLYHIVEAVGRWSMIDVFVISILTALVRAGSLATITPGPGVLCFCAVVILTMLSAQMFDPRLMWDRAAQRHGAPAP